MREYVVIVVWFATLNPFQFVSEKLGGEVVVNIMYACFFGGGRKCYWVTHQMIGKRQNLVPLGNGEGI